MDIQIKKIILKNSFFEVEGLYFKTSGEDSKPLALMTHGYTSSKNSILSWAMRLSQEGCNVILFDLPGHFLGSFHDISSFKDFTEHAHELFLEALKISEMSPQKIILMGHSLGAFLALKAASLFQKQYPHIETLNLAVGLGMLNKDDIHLMETPLYKPILDMRRQLVSTHLAPENVFSWLKKQKEDEHLTRQRIILINGQNDAVVGSHGSQNLTHHLEKLGNDVFLETPKNLPHHQPEMASSHIVNILKKRYQVF